MKETAKKHPGGKATEEIFGRGGGLHFENGENGKQ